jgi:predicted polyphosphate/ATP-dependent NAD kinase
MSHKSVGLIINPVAGLGGRVGLKGSDGLDIQNQARRLGAEPTSQGRALEALANLRVRKCDLEFYSYPGEMGADALQAAGFPHEVLGRIESGHTTAADTRLAVLEMQALGVELLFFTGGDGTARDIYSAIGTNLPVLGIPAGVKILSGVYAVHPRAAGQLGRAYLDGEISDLREMEVLDLDEDEYRQGLVSPKLFGYLRVPYQRGLVQVRKMPNRLTEEASVEAIAQDVIDQMDDDHLYIIGPGTTTRQILTRLGLEKTLIGVDVLYQRQLIAADANETLLLNILKHHPAIIVVTPIGGQGYILGRGNQQLSPTVLRQVGVERILVVSTLEKLLTLNHRPLLVDTGDAELDTQFQGFIKVITGYHDRLVYPVKG